MFQDVCENVVIAVYVDDILIAGKTDEGISEVKAAIVNHFEVKDMGQLHYLLGVKVVQDQEAGIIWLGQPAYSESIIQQFNMQNAVNSSLKLTKANEK